MASKDGLNPFIPLHNLTAPPAPSAQEIEDDENNPFIPIFHSRQIQTPPPRETAVERLGKGVGRGLIHPVRAFTPGDVAEGQDLGIAGAVGEFIGAGLTFAPLGKAANTVLRGVGLLKTGTIAGTSAFYLSPFGATTAGVRAAHVAKWGLAGAGFEAFSGELDEAPEKAAAGLIGGVAFELAGMGIAKAWRSARGTWKPMRPTPIPTPSVQDVAVHPLALRLENWMRPSMADKPELVLAKLKALGDPQEQLHAVFLDVMKTQMPGGQALLAGLSKKEITQLFKVTEAIGTSRVKGRLTRSLNMGVFRRVEGEDAFDVLVVDGDRSIWQSVLKQNQGKMTMQELHEEILKAFTDVKVEFPKFLPGARGRYTPMHWSMLGDQIAKIEVIPEQQKFANVQGAVSTLLHELMHHIQYRRIRKNIPGLGPAASVIEPTLQNFIRILDPAVKKVATKNIIVESAKQQGAIAEITRQLQQATEELLVLEYQGMFGKTPEVAREKAKNLIRFGSHGNPGYYKEPAEMLSRMAELMFVNPSLAKKVAPMAFKIVGGVIHQEAPAIRQLMSREAQVVLDMFEDTWRIFGDSAQTVLTRGRPQFSQAQLIEFGKTGWTKGLRALMEGKEYEFLEKAGEGTAKIRSLDTGAISVRPLAKLQRALFQSVASRNEEIIKAIDGVLDSRPTSLPINLLEQVPTGPGQQATTISGVRRALINTEGYLTINTSIRQWLKSLPIETQEKLIQDYGQIRPRELSELKALGPAAAKDVEILKKAVELTGHKGLIRNDNGFLEVLVGSDDHVVRGTIIESQKFGAPIAGSGGDQILIPNIDDWLKHQLREAGVPEVDVDYFHEIAHKRLGERLRNLMSQEAKQVDENVKTALAKQAQAADAGVESEFALEDVGIDGDEIARAGISDRMLPDGRIELRDAQTQTVLATLRNRDEALAYAMEMGADNTGPRLGDFPGGSGHGGGALPPKKNSQMFPPNPVFPPKGQKGSNLIDAITLPVISALENFAKMAERRLMGPAYTRVYLPTHNAMLEVQRELSTVVRKGLGTKIVKGEEVGRTFKDALQEISDKLIRVSRKRYEIITGHIEAMSKDEIAAGLMSRPMTQNEVRVAKSIEQMGLGQDIPRLMSLDRLIDATVVSSDKLETVINRMRQIKLSPEATELLTYFESLPKNLRTRDEVMKYLKTAGRLTDEEQSVIKIIRDSTAVNKDQFSIYAVSRYASAPALKKGFKTGKEQFAFENGMTENELAVSDLASKTLEAGFKDSGLDAKRHLSGYWPHLRVWVQEGFEPDRFILPNDVLQWVASRYRSGELNVYDMDPLSTVYRHLRGLYMKRHFDPVMPDVNAALFSMKQTDARAYNVMNEYVLELMGKPHASFEKLQDAISRTAEILLGKKVNPRLAQDIVSGISAVISAAVIPFRPVLIMRNFAESLLKVAPRTGPNAYFKALQYVVSQETRKEAFAAAVKAGAIRPGTQKLRSLHSAEELFGARSPDLIHKYLQVFDKGFEWYQSADDWGRAIAYHAQRIRIAEHLDDFQRGRITLETFKDRAKINTFDPLDVEIAERHFLSGNHEKAIDHLGQVLSKEAMTRYGYADHPAGWHSVQGRLFGQFGTWPVQYKDYLLQGVSRGSTKDKIEFLGIHGAISGAIIGGGASVGLNLSTWTGSVVYTGGPFTDLSIDVVRSITGSDAEKALARRNLYAQIPILGWMETGNPRSVFLPGSYLLGDLDAARRALQDDNIFEGVMSGLGVRVMRPEERMPLQDIFEDIF